MLEVTYVVHFIHNRNTARRFICLCLFVLLSILYLKYDNMNTEIMLTQTDYASFMPLIANARQQ